MTGRARPAADPVFAAELRGFLDDGLAGLSGPSTAGGTGRLQVTSDRLAQALSCPVHRAAGRWEEPAVAPPGGQAGPRRAFSSSLACGALVGALFRQFVTVGGVDDPMGDALEALSLDEHQAPLVDWISGMSAAERCGLSAEVERQTCGLLERWPTLDASWMPRTQEMLRAPLVGGAVELCVRVDLALGRPIAREASVALVDVVSGVRRPAHGDDRRFAALVAALRGPVPPFAVATYYSRTGELDVDPVDHEFLVVGAQRCLAGVQVLAGSDPVPSDGSACAACRTLLRRPPVVVPVDAAAHRGGSVEGPELAARTRVPGIDSRTRAPEAEPAVAFPQEVAA